MLSEWMWSLGALKPARMLSVFRRSDDRGSLRYFVLNCLFRLLRFVTDFACNMVE
jgi:hypothetical protein